MCPERRKKTGDVTLLTAAPRGPRVLRKPHRLPVAHGFASGLRARQGERGGNLPAQGRGVAGQARGTPGLREPFPRGGGGT